MPPKKKIKSDYIKADWKVDMMKFVTHTNLLLSILNSRVLILLCASAISLIVEETSK